MGALLGTAALITLAPAVASAADEPEIGTGVGQMYPDFMLPKIDGGSARLSDFRGKKVLLLHFASW